MEEEELDDVEEPEVDKDAALRERYETIIDFAGACSGKSDYKF